MELAPVESLGRLGPELALGVALVAVWLAGSAAGAAAEIAVLGAAASFFLTTELYGSGEVWVLDRALVVDGLALTGKAFVALALLGSLSAEARAGAQSRRLTRFLVAGLALDAMGSAGSTVPAYLGFEIAASAIASLGSTAAVGVTAAATLSSLTVAGALAFISGVAGSTDYEAIRRSVVEVAPFADVRVAVAAWLLLAGIGVRVGVVALRVRNDAGSGLLFGVGLVMGALVLVLRSVFGALGMPGVEATGAGPILVGGSGMLVVAASAAVLSAAFCIARSRSLPALLVASSIAALGYALVEASGGTREAIGAALVSGGASIVPMLGAFEAASITAGAGSTGPRRAALVAPFLVAVGASPLVAQRAGAPGVFTAALRAGGEIAFLSVFACLAIQLDAYARAIASLVIEPVSPRVAARPGLADLATLGLLALLTAALAIDPRPLVRLAAWSAALLPV